MLVRERRRQRLLYTDTQTPPASHPQEDSPPLPEVAAAAAAAADKGALCQASCLLPAELLLRLLPMLPTPKGTLPTKACVNSTATRRDSNSKPATAAVLLLLDDDGILHIFGGVRKSRSALACA